MKWLRYLIIGLMFWSIASSLNAQQKSIQAVRTDEKIHIDGILNENDWKKALPAGDFIVFHPNNGKIPDQVSEVRILYDDNAVYIGAVLYDSEPANIYTELTVRDKDNANVDYFGISINPNNDGQNVYEFIVSAANVQTDIRITGDNSDLNWDAVWHSEIQITEFGWIVEIEIPYSAIRFPKAEKQIWAVNFWRTVRRTREISSWNYVDPNIGNKISQMGLLKDVRDIDAPLRLSLMPYLSSYVNHYSESGNTGYSFSGGLDLKLGLSETYTLDMTLIPDFGQVKSDEEVLNLTPHETYYTENRPFFTEGTELFNKCGLFYSRRIGKIPSQYYAVQDLENHGYRINSNPRYSSLINAFKISGRGENNLAIGVFNAITGNTYARHTNPEGEDEKMLTEHAANYNMIVLDQSLGRFSYLNFTNANVFRGDNAYLSNVSATAFKIMDKKNLFGLNGTMAYSTQNNKAGNISDGWYMESSAGKMNGKWIYSYNNEIISDNYNPNDMGYLTRFNQISHSLNLSFRQFTPFSVFNEMTHRLSMNYNSLYSQNEFTSTEIIIHSYATTKKFTSYWNTFTYEPMGKNDYYEPRVAGRFYHRPAMMINSFFISTDYRKRLAADVRIGLYKDNELREGVYGSISPLMRFGQRLSLRYRFNFDFDLNEAAYVDKAEEDIIFGRRNVFTFANSINADYIFTNKIALSIVARHYASTVEYKHFYNLQQNGRLELNAEFNEDRNYNFNSFTIDLVFSWNFAPGSFLNFVWKNNVSADGTIPPEDMIPNYYANFKQIWHEPLFNSLSLKLIYYLDYSSL
jgi:hypothetical protein